GLEALAAEHDCIVDVRGLGLMVGMEVGRDGVSDPALRDRIIELAFRRGLLLLPCGPSTVRFCPPLCLTRRQVDAGLEVVESAFAAGLARRMREATSTRFVDWVDHLVLADRPGLARRLEGLGYAREAIAYAVHTPIYGHPGAIFPRVAVVPGAGPEVREVAIKV